MTAEWTQTISVERSNEFPFLVFPDLRFFALSLLPGHNPAQDKICPSVGKRDMSVPITAMTVSSLVLPIPGISWMVAAAIFPHPSYSGLFHPRSLMCSTNWPICVSMVRIIFFCSSLKTPFRSSTNCSSVAFRLEAIRLFPRISVIFDISIFSPLKSVSRKLRPFFR